MSELRKDFLTDTLVTVAEERGARPVYYRAAKASDQSEQSEGDCPFCPHNEYLTPEDLYRSGDGRVRVFANKYPAFSENSGAYGFNEVIADTPCHTEKLYSFSLTGICSVFDAVISRLTHFSKNPRIRYVQIFKNEGRNAGASIYHSHWQIFALDFIPELQKKIYGNFDSYHSGVYSCFLCDIQKSEGLLTFYENRFFFAYSPYASPYAHMIHIVPKKHVRDFAEFDSAFLLSLAEALKTSLAALNAVKPGLSYNICFQNTPYNLNQGEYPNSHFFIQIIPRFGSMAGFEFSTNCFINHVKPERSCELLKEAVKNL